MLIVGKEEAIDDAIKVLQGHFQVKDPTSLENYLGVQIVQSDDGKKPTSPTYSTDSQAALYSPTSILINLEPQSSPPFISLPILPGGILMVITDPQLCQRSDRIPILPIPNHFKLH